MIKTFVLALMTVWMAACSQGGDASGELEMLDGWVRTPIPGRSNTAAYLTLKNASDSDWTLVSVSTEQAARVELHQHSEDGGMMRMRQVDSVTIAAGETQELMPGGYHLMLFDVGEHIAHVKAVAFELSAADGRKARFLLPLRSVLDGDSQGSHHGGMH